MQGTLLEILDSIKDMPFYAKVIGTIAVLGIGGVGVNTTMGFHYLRRFKDLKEQVQRARGAFSKGNYTSNFAIADETIIERVLDERSGKQKVIDGKRVFLMRLDTSQSSVSLGKVFEGDFQSEAMRFIERARQQAKPGGGTKLILELLRHPDVITESDLKRLKTSRETIIDKIESAWTRSCAEYYKQNGPYTMTWPQENNYWAHMVRVLVAEPDGRDNQLRIFEIPQWQLDEKNLPSPDNDIIWVENTLADLFAKSGNYHHDDNPDNPQLYRIKSIRDTVRAMMHQKATLLKPNIARIRTGNIYTVSESHIEPDRA